MAPKEPAGPERDLQARLQAVIAERDQLALQLHEREADRQEFFATLAHEMRNPLAAMRSAVHVLRIAENDQALARATHAMIERQVAQLSRLIDDLTDVAHVAQGHLELRCERASLEVLLRKAIDANRAALESRQQHPRLQLPPGPIWLNVDSRRIVQVFAGILSNSSKFSDLGTEIRIKAVQENEWLTVAITDQGAEAMTDGNKSVQTRKLDLVSKDPGIRNSFSHVIIWIDPARDVSLKQVSYQASGDTRTMYYTNIRLNQPVDLAPFAIKCKGKCTVVIH